MSRRVPSMKPKLLIVTQIVDKNDPVLGFMHGWIEAFSQECEQLLVIGLSVGQYSFPSNVQVLSLGKESGASRLKYIYRMLRYSIQYRHMYDTVFAHMNPEYVVPWALVWRSLGKKVSLWYAHGKVTLMLRLGAALCNKIFTSTALGFRIKTDKLSIVGQGIDTNLFTKKENAKNEPFSIVTIGRIAPSKDYETLILASECLLQQGVSHCVTIIGGIGQSGYDKYFEDLKRMVTERKFSHIEFLGPKTQAEIVSYLHNATVFANMGQTGSLDKAMLEGMSCGTPVVSCNEALEEILGPELKSRYMYPKKDYQAFAKRLAMIAKMTSGEYISVSNTMHDIVAENHSLRSFVKKIVSHL